MKKTLLFLLALSFSTITFAQQYVITGNITGFPNGTKFYLKDNDVDALIDSTTIQNNQFSMKGKLAETPQNLWIYAQAYKKFYYTNLLIKNEALTIKGDIKDFPYDLRFSGSKTQDEYASLTNLTKANDKRRHELVNDYFALKGDSIKIKSKQIWAVIGKIDKANDSITVSYVKRNLNSYNALFQLFYLKSKMPKDSLQKIYDAINPQFKQTRFAQRVGNYLKVGNILKKGDQITDFAGLDKDGKTHHLTDVKSKYTLLDFSTTYCGPCIESIADIKILKDRYANQLEIITFSGDGGKATWLEGIKRDKPTWLSIWDGKGNYGETILKYGVVGYPTFVLVDPQGKIAESWSGYGKEPGEKGSLETKVDKVLSEKK